MDQQSYNQDYYQDLFGRMRDLEEKLNLAKERTVLISKTLVEERDKNFKEIQEMKKTLFKLKEENLRMKDFMQNLAEQLDNTARREELEILKNQFDLFRK